MQRQRAQALSSFPWFAVPCFLAACADLSPEPSPGVSAGVEVGLLAACESEEPAAEPAHEGVICMGPSASGEAERILAGGFTLKPLHACQRAPLALGPQDLEAPWIVARARETYAAGHAVALTEATADQVERLRALLGHRGSAQLTEDHAAAELVAFRKALRPDGKAHFSSHLLLPRVDASPRAHGPHGKHALRGLRRAAARARKVAKRRAKEQQETADRGDLEVLRTRIFSVDPELPELPEDSPEQNLMNLAESYLSHTVRSNSDGEQVQIVNTVWAARSFTNQADLYYVLQELDYRSEHDDPEFPWFNTAQSSLQSLSGTAALIQVSPQTTEEARTITSGTDYTIGGSAGWNETQGLNALISGGVSINNSTSVTVPPIVVTSEANFDTAATDWIYVLSDSNAGTITLYNQWIWSVPFTAYQSAQADLQFKNEAELDILLGAITLKADLVSSVPLPFGQTFTLEPPSVTGIAPPCVDSGEAFEINGSGFYPNLVQSVLIGGTQVGAANITTTSDAQISVIAPDTIECHDSGCSVVVQTAEGTSNADQSIVISAFCDLE